MEEWFFDDDLTYNGGLPWWEPEGSNEITREMDVMQFFSEDLSEFDNNGNSSSASSLPSLSTGSSESRRQWSIQLPEGSEDEVLTRAMVAVISSASPSSCSSSSTSSLSSPSVQSLINKTRNYGQFPSFRIYSPILASAVNSDPRANLHSQKMIKKSITMLRRINKMRNQESALPSNQVSHMISERRRREKLNGSFDQLRSLLPPGSKKDRATVLMKTKDCLKTLKDQISELQLENRMLEMKLKCKATDEIYEQDLKASNFRSTLRVEIIKASVLSSEVQQISLRLTANANSALIDLVLHVLECLKEMRVLALVSVDGNIHTTQMNLHATATIEFQIKECDWYEELFKEAMIRSIKRVARPELVNFEGLYSGDGQLFMEFKPLDDD
ncbi:Myc-type basic helix-loop-helix (bHLH) domain-containing protein [Dioscorea alata]|uniref:Myc-type basic helix-loop-helix (BHLH) domain-containing protein n=1 Tax=Dioscorea alata TaxID=55571 RepID=A0ACB7WEN3_DIOAL|nr:Myc-type basic helix-loop-helix (bHLH) domain-containing protein [Dioscorea alata]